jgi:hypothetical protein
MLKEKDKNIACWCLIMLHYDSLLLPRGQGVGSSNLPSRTNNNPVPFSVVSKTIDTYGEMAHELR